MTQTIEREVVEVIETAPEVATKPEVSAEPRIYVPPQVSVQLIIFGERNRTDISGVLKEVAQAGYSAIEAGNMFETYGEETTRRLLGENNLKVSGAHFGYGDYADPEKLKKHIAYAQAIGLKNMMCSGVSDSKTTVGYLQSSELFQEVGRILKEEGLVFQYHNHAWEFDELDNINGMEIIAQETDADLVKFNMDIFWLHYADEYPVYFIEDYADRAGYFHFKDGNKIVEGDKVRPEFLELGNGEVDLIAAFEAAKLVNLDWIVTEQDNTKLTPLESITISRNYLKSNFEI